MSEILPAMTNYIKNTPLFLFLLLIGFSGFAQQNDQDSVLIKLNGMTNNEKINHLSQSINDVIFQQPKKQCII